MNMHSTVKAPGSNYLCMYRELENLNMQKSRVEQNVRVSHAEKTFTHTCTNALTYTHNLDIYHKYPHIALLILFLAQWGYTTLLRAAYRGHAGVVRMLMDCGSTPNEVTNVSVHPAPMSTDSV